MLIATEPEKEPTLTRNGILIWEAGDPLFARLGGASEKWGKKYQDVLNALLREPQTTGSASGHIVSSLRMEEFLQLLSDMYVTGSRPFVVQERPSPHVSYRQTRFSFGLRGQAIHRALFPQTRAYCIRDRYGTVIGVQNDRVDEVLDPDRPGLSLEAWKEHAKPLRKVPEKGYTLWNFR